MSMPRLQFIVIPGLVAVLLFLGVNLLEQPGRSGSTDGQITVIDYNGYSEGINTVHFDERGRIRYTLSADRQITYLNSETALEHPVIRLYQGMDSRWNITASSGRISAVEEQNNDVEQIVLSGNVEVHQLNAAGNGTVLSTDILQLNPDADVLITDADVLLTSNNFEQSATGMRVDLNSEEYIFFRNTRGRYAAREN